VTHLPAVLLTGGQSRRMGRDKATLVLNGEPLAARAARVLSEVCDPVVEVGHGVTTLRAVRENPAGSGPLAALLAGVDALETTGPVMLLACDMPFVEAPLLRVLADWPGSDSVIPLIGMRAQYGCARYGPEWLAAALESRRAGNSSFKRVDDAFCTYVGESKWLPHAAPHALDDIDTPEDLARSIES
jgi:molybdenum cofactor guanylyltransferase